MINKEKLMHNVFLVSASISILAVTLICLFLFFNGVPAMFEIGLGEFLLGDQWKPSDSPASYGILPMVLGSIYVTLGAIILGVPIGVFTAVFLATSCPKKLYKFLKPTIELLASIPSVVYGFFGIFIIVPFVASISGNGFSMISASILLAIMILPTIISISETSIQAVPKTYYEGAVALGGTHERSVFFIVVPAAKSGILSSIVLGIGRAIGETMAVVMVAGNQPRMPKGAFRGVRTMTSNIVLEMGYATGLHREALIATGVILFIFILLINLVFAIVKRRLRNVY